MRNSWSTVGLVALAASYIGSYIALHDPEAFTLACSLGCSRNLVHRVPRFRVPHFRAFNTEARRVFKPLMWIDQKVRTNYWQYMEDLSPGADSILPLGSPAIGFGGSMGSLEAFDALPSSVKSDE